MIEDYNKTSEYIKERCIPKYGDASLFSFRLNLHFVYLMMNT
jgi:hypothetical protein